MSTKILIFTNTYPYGSGETFFAAELEYLAGIYKEVIISPLQGSGKARKVPSNVKVLSPVYTHMSRISVLIKGIFSLVNLGRIYFVFNTHFIENIGQYFVARAIFRRKDIRQAISGCNLKYFYWGKGAANINVFFDLPGKKVVRLHGYDLYESDVRPGNIVPLRKFLARYVDNFIFVSDHGKRYFRSKYNIDGKVFRLGVKKNGLNPLPCKVEKVLVTCSFLHPVKRVWMLAEALQFSREKIFWFHIGDGAERERLLLATKALPSNVSFDLLGSMTNEEVMAFYRKQPIDIFVSVSESEGLPVSMMEALSFGIPILATDVGGVSEIVTPEVGWVITPNISPKELGYFIDSILTHQDLYRKRTAAVNFHKENYDIDRNNIALGNHFFSLK